MTTMTSPLPSLKPALLLLLLVLPAARAEDRSAQDVPMAEVRAAVDKACAFLLDHHFQPGLFIDDQRVGREMERRQERPRPPSHANALTALALMGLSSVGHLPGDPTPEGIAASQSLDFLLSQMEGEQDGYFGRTDGSRMYGQGIMTLMLAEMLGMGVSPEQDRDLARMCRRGINLILRSQQIEKRDGHEGGWRYEPDSTDSDISVTVWHLMALRAAHNAGIEVPKSAIDDAVAYVKRSYRGDDTPDAPVSQATFSYQAQGGQRQASTTAAGVLSLQVCGHYDAHEVAGGANYLLHHPPAPGDSWFYYGIYYYAQGMYQRGGDYADTARRYTEQTLLSEQEGDGCWNPKNGSERGSGKIYSTALALLSLSVRYHLLPIYQR